MKWTLEDLARLFQVTWQMDTQEDFHMLSPKGSAETIGVIVNCSDLFWWATSDAEEFLPSDIDDLVQCYEDLKATEGKETWWATTLWCCRKRQMRPQGPWYGYETPDGEKRRERVAPDIEALFDACGPERSDSMKIPRPVA